MSDIYTSIDLGTNSIKVVVCEKHNDDFHVLAAVSSKSQGIKNGQIEDTKLAVTSVRNAIKKVNAMLGIKITKVLACVPPTGCRMDIVVGSVDVIDYEKITGEDVRGVLKDALVGHIDEEYEIVTASPISFTVDDKENIKDPKGMSGKSLEAKVVVSTLLKEPLYRILQVLKLAGLETIDMAYSSTGDYYTIASERTSDVVGAIIDIGERSTNVSIFNKGIQIKNDVIPIGSFNVDQDISYIFKLRLPDSRKLKETFAVASANYASGSDVMECLTMADENKEISQVGASKVVQARIEEILKLAKISIKNLTNREIRYIIVTGGLSELAGFQYLLEDTFGTRAKVCNIPVMGLRHNKYSSVFGVIKYFDDKLLLRGKRCNMIGENDREILISTGQNATINDNIVSRVFGHFFDN